MKIISKYSYRYVQLLVNKMQEILDRPNAFLGDSVRDVDRAIHF